MSSSSKEFDIFKGGFRDDSYVTVGCTAFMARVTGSVYSAF
jgi:hypothetical protein